MYYFFLTIDKVKLGLAPNKAEIMDIFSKIVQRCDLHPLLPHPINAFEYKYKGGKCGHWLHYHCIVISENWFIPYKNVKVQNWSVKLEKLKSVHDVARVAAYIQKLKVDYCDLRLKICEIKKPSQPTHTPSWGC